MYTILHHTADGICPSASLKIAQQDQLVVELQRQVSIARTSPTVVQMIGSDYSTTKLVALDLDGTLTSAEYMKRLAEYSGNSDAIKSLTESAIEGQSKWDDNFTKRVKLLAGISVKTANQVANDIPLAKGAEEFITALKKKGISIVIITGAYQGLAEVISKKLDIDEVYSSQFEIENNSFTGKVRAPFLTPENKAKKLIEIISEKGLHPYECMAIGDSYNDIPMLATAGQALIYHAIQKAPLPLTSLTQFI